MHLVVDSTGLKSMGRASGRCVNTAGANLSVSPSLPSRNDGLLQSLPVSLKVAHGFRQFLGRLSMGTFCTERIEN